MLVDTLLALLGGAKSATAIRADGRPGRIILPDDEKARRELVALHVAGRPAMLQFVASGDKVWKERVPAVALGAYCPDADGRARWIAVDVDAADGHGEGGLLDPRHAARCLAEQAEYAGLGGGLLTATSRGGKGRHVWLLLPDPTPLADAVVGLAAIAAAAMRVSHQDAADGPFPHAFSTAKGVAELGQPGAVELFPRSVERPAYGWPLTLPGAGVYAERGGGLLVDVLDGEPNVTLRAVPRADAYYWHKWVFEARARTPRARPRSRKKFDWLNSAPYLPRDRRGPLAFLDGRGRAFLEGRTTEGARNAACFSTACTLLGHGMPEGAVYQLVLGGGRACGMSMSEVKVSFASAVRAVARRKGVRA
ncbi:MAG: hypothetical protein IPM18_18005 [Phycisphaerales bacterium]|nr:hypothetical protein [Phycisphaerales bacterium]